MTIGAVWHGPSWGASVWAPNTWASSVSAAPVALFSVTGTGYVRTFDSTASFDESGIIVRAWTFGDGGTAGDVAVTSHTYSAAGTYAVTLTVTNVFSVSTVFSTQVTIAAAVVVVPTPVPVVVVQPTSADVAGTSAVRICNMALAHTGTDTQIESLTGRSKEARACNLFYGQVRDEVLREFKWNFAQRRDVLALVEDDPTTVWGHSYRYPADALLIHRMPNGVTRIDASQALRVVYEVGSDDAGRLLYTDLDDAELEYTARVTDVTQYPPDFVSAVALRLGAMIAPMLVTDGATAIRDKLLGLYQYEIGIARQNSANESAPDVPPDSEFITSRW